MKIIDVRSVTLIQGKTTDEMDGHCEEMDGEQERVIVCDGN